MIHGTWWGLHRAIDAHKLVRVKIDISNDQDRLWGIDIKKSTAKPLPEIRNDLARIIRQITEKGSRPFTGRGRKIEDKTTTRFWEIVPFNDDLRFALNLEHPIYLKLVRILLGRRIADFLFKRGAGISAARGDSIKFASQSA